MSDNHSDQAPGQNKTTIIIVNGRQREFVGQKISYSQVVQLAFPDDQSNSNIEYTVAFANPHGKDGTLVNGQDVHVKEGMIFNVTKTNRS
ncbi:multiubiquitin domain-containing protein [Desulfobulbus sp. US4]|nr:multiubiquitin domain-containing protein [Desulfobulbus sp. US4]